ncbi:SDR family NAD(P)-dependent oxidoreductase [Sphingobium subterraneum]|uniref:NAD(P)-dependent dehydrogenase (Short-subunit alcohol dehydrogenase family) n=1 Tax=Sphingobium subterraneum TaxID=627688 RepID=A0A841J4T4_9SPHN|nr:SDR family oxidoreductase [Sphingobium subterraneum]MBB6125352.1 NAD(P)-dependent dehydrogenase (short-subunit alcohol dehydrogenase family) [Sphingobium subterraneum]
MRNLKGKVVLVTGGGAGIGEATVARFVEEGSLVVVTDIDEAKGRQVADRLSCPFVPINVADAASVERAIAAAVEHFGRLDIIVNNAGVVSERALIHESTQENWDRVLRINLDGVYYGMKYALRHFVAQGSGVIVNVTSTAALVAFAQLPPYNASKAAVSQLTKEAAIEYAAMGIRANAVAPTGLLTPMNEKLAETTGDAKAFIDHMSSMNPMPGMPTADDIAAAIAFLASDDARFITGVTLAVDGGYTAQ